MEAVASGASSSIVDAAGRRRHGRDQRRRHRPGHRAGGRRRSCSSRSSPPSAQGMGVGLSISRTIIEAHGGQIWAEPNPGGGTVFRFTLRAVTQGGASAMPSDSHRACHRRRRGGARVARVPAADGAASRCGPTNRATAFLTALPSVHRLRRHRRAHAGDERHRSAAAAEGAQDRACRSSSSPAMATCRSPSRR